MPERLPALRYADVRCTLPVRSTLADRLDRELPQTQCTRCGFAACRPYAEAIADGQVDINRCPPGGDDGIVALAALLGRAPKLLDPVFGMEAPPTVAVIDEAICIGCTKCIQACPVDAIVGAAKRMHAIIDAECTGCELCVAPCPVDCISMVAISAQMLDRDPVLARAAHARARYETRNRRLAREHEEPLQRRVNASSREVQTTPPPITRSAVLEAIARGRARRLQGDKNPPST